jgi:hypothetical protein
MKSTARLAGIIVVASLTSSTLPLFAAPRAWACGSYPNWTPDLCSNEQEFIDQLAAAGIEPTRSAVDLSSLGWKICGDLFLGRTQEFEANRVYAHNTGLGGDGARTVVRTAVAVLCPEAAVQRNLPPYPPQYNIP